MALLLLLVGCSIPGKEPDQDGDGFSVAEGDCADADPDVRPGAPERCDGIDQDCDGALDEDATDATISYVDADGDGIGGVASSACGLPSGNVTTDGDCDDGDPAVHPGAVETCDGIDSNCADGEADASDPLPWYLDADADTYGAAGSPVFACDAPATYVPDATDCDDGSAAVHPGAAEICDNGIDDDCSADAAGCRLTGESTSWDLVVTDPDGGDFGMSLDAGWDVDGDGAEDLLAGNTDDGYAYLFTDLAGASALEVSDASSVFGVGNPTNNFGLHVAFAGDFDGDGVTGDVAVLIGGDDTAGNDAGAVAVYFAPLAATYGGDAGGADAFLTGTADTIDAGLGTSGLGYYQALEAVGDFDGDGATDLLVGAFNAEEGGLQVGEAWLVGGVSGSRGLADATVVFEGEAVGSQAGSCVDGGDVNGDGLDDAVVGARFFDAGSGGCEGALYVVFGEATPPAAVDLGAADLVLHGPTAYDRVGSADTVVPDVTGDGVADLAVSAAITGAVYLVEGTRTGTWDAASAASITYTDTTGGTFYGGDVDGDGATDLYYTYYPTGSYLLHGPLEGGSALDWDFSSPELALPIELGDVDGDGHDDLVAGSYGGDYVRVRRGRGL